VITSERMRISSLSGLKKKKTNGRRGKGSYLIDRQLLHLRGGIT
jgi:hypothetical protein